MSSHGCASPNWVHWAFPNAPVEITVNQQMLVYTVEGPEKLCQLFADNLAVDERAVGGSVSPLHAVTLDKFTREQLSIPKSARMFAFVYPVDNNEHFADPKAIDMFKPEHALLIHGGYAYFDKDGNVVQVNAIGRGGADICFDGPYQLPEETLQALADKGRLHAITIRKLWDNGMRKFAWVRPGERLPGMDEKIWPHGAFVYQYENEEMNNVFSVAPASEVTGSTDRKKIVKFAMAGASTKDFLVEDEQVAAATTAVTKAVMKSNAKKAVEGLKKDLEDEPAQAAVVAIADVHKPSNACCTIL